MFTRTALAGLAVLTAGCMATSRSLQLPDGQPGYAVSCPGSEMDWGNCYSKAAVLCPAAGYAVVERQEHHGQRTSVTMAGVHSVPTISRTIFIACQEAL